MDHQTLQPKKTFFRRFWWIGIFLILMVTIAILFYFNKRNDNIPDSEVVKKENAQTDSNIIKSIGFNLDYYNPSTKKAGDLEFFKLPSNFIFTDYGYIIPADQTTSRTAQAEPHPSIILPLGTKVFAPIDGIVVAVPTLYSNDNSVQITPDGKMNGLIFELEHVKNPIVKAGDKVTAGQPVAEVTDFSSHNHPGYGYFDLAVFHTDKNGQPEHLCPFLYLDNSIKGETYKKIRALYVSWEEYIGDKNIYSDKYDVPGCVTIDPIKG